MNATGTPWDVVIVGGGPAGLSAALILGRCMRKVLVCDAGTPRNRATKAIHGYLSRDGVAPPEFRAAALAELRRYDGVTFWDGEVTKVKKEGAAFRVVLSDRRTATARKLLLATGLYDDLPEIPGLAGLLGRSVFHCPYCDGWEARRAPVAVYGKGVRALEMARAMTAWTGDIVVCTDGPSKLGERDASDLHANGIQVRQERIARLAGEAGRLRAVVFADGTELERSALVFDMPSHQQSLLARQLGCAFNRNGGVRCGKYEATQVPGVYVAGNTIKDVHLAIVAAAEGAKAAMGINKALTREDFTAGATGVRPVEHPQVD